MRNDSPAAGEYQWKSRREILDFLARDATFSADTAVMNAPRTTRANDIEIAVRAALHALEANGWIKFTPPTGRYEYRISPPEDPEPPEEGR